MMPTALTAPEPPRSLLPGGEVVARPRRGVRRVEPAGRRRSGVKDTMAAAVDAKALALSLKRLRQPSDGAVLTSSLQRIAESCVELFGLSGSGLMLADEHGELRYVASTDARSHLLEEVQIETGQGPCIESYVRAAMVAFDD